MKKITIDDLRQANREITKIQSELEKYFEDAQRLEQSIRSEYDNKIRAIESQRDARIDELEESHNYVRKSCLQSSATWVEITQQFDKISSLLKVKFDALHVSLDDIEHTRWGESSEKTKELVDMFQDHEYLKIMAVIIENKKPVNKYSLCLFGKNINFPRNLFEFKKSYNIDANASNYGVGVLLKDFSSIESAKQYYWKYKTKIISSQLTEYFAMIEECLEVQKTYSIEDLRPIIQYECSCGYFLTDHETQQYAQNGLKDKCWQCDGPWKFIKEETEAKIY